MEIIQSIALDFAQNATQATVFAKQYDKDTRKIEITPLNNGSPYTIDTDVTARLQMNKNDGTTVINNAEISSGKITVVLTAQALTSAGTAVAEIGLYKGSTLLSSQTFYIDVQKGAYDEDAPESSDEYNALVEALGEAEQATATAEAASERAEAAVDSANTAIEAARTVATGKMSLIPIDPTVEEIEAMPSGQIYGDTVNHKGIVKDGQEFYDTAAIDALLSNKQNAIRYEQPLKHNVDYTQNDLFNFFGCICRYAYSAIDINLGKYNVFTHFTHIYKTTSVPPPNVFMNIECPYETGDLLIYYKLTIYAKPTAANITRIEKIFVCTELNMYKDSYGNFMTKVTWEEKPLDYYSKDEIDTMIGNIESLLAEV